ncbi:MAG TPA: glycosyltransferase family 39 protein [Tepidisphaeraceae bacterium]|jgi:hypothetical protein|nr:glycosyltransferase family 39 protein [Tepidisphaeraceae bacterium]
MARRIEKWLIPPIIFAAVVFLVGINWGLPSRKVDPFLFGDHPVWSGKEIAQLLGNRGSLSMGADVDANPNRLRPMVLNDTDEKRAEIVARYRLYSYQPDEMITFRALSTIPQTHGDPRLYQYGGLWVYPVGVLLKIASVVGVVELRSSVEFYLDHPEQFGRFYLIARLYVFAWAMVGVWAVFWLAKKMTGDRVVAMLAAIAYAAMPVVINMAHEAKPHLPGVVLMLLAVMAGVKYVETSSRRWAVGAGALCGAAFGMVLTGVLAFILLPIMCFLRWRAKSPLAPSRFFRALIDCILATLAGALVYSITNPFVVLHLLGDREVLFSNLQNTQAMYRELIQPDTLLGAAKLIAMGATPALAVLGAAAILFAPRKQDIARKLMLGVAVLVLVQFVMLSMDKPGEYARFGIFLDIALMLLGFGAIGSVVTHPKIRWAVLGVLCAITMVWTAGYVWHFTNDSLERTSRMIIAKRLQETFDRGARELAIYNDPAPYCLPPVDLFKWKMVLVDSGGAPTRSTDVLIRPIDSIPKQDTPMLDFEVVYWTRPRLLDTPISWAAKPFRVLVRKGYVETN